MSYTTEDIRNLTLIGQAGAGKTLLGEAILHQAGEIPSKGEISRKTTVSDYDVLEKQHQRSLTSSVLSFDYDGKRVNLIDTPGYSDFLGPAITTIDAVETAVVVINAQIGIETMTRRYMEWAKERNVCIAIVINRMDTEGADLEGVYNSIQEEFGSECLAVNLPADGGSSVVGCLFDCGGTSDFSSVEDGHTAIVDQVVEVDEELMEEYLESGEVSKEQLVPTFKQAMREGHLIPVCFTSAETDAGVPELLTMIASLFPNPLEGNMQNFEMEFNGETNSIDVEPDPQKELIAHFFKVAFDPFVGKIGVFRIHQGTIQKDASVYFGDSRKAIRIANLYSLLGKQHNDVTEGIAGDIRAISKVEEVQLNCVFHASNPGVEVKRESHSIPSPMVGLAIAPASRGDEQKVSEALHKVAAEDPCITLDRNPAANETILRGLGDLHLRICLERLNEVYNVEVTTSIPTIPYKETVTKMAEGHCRHKKQTGGAGQFGEVFMRVEPLPRGDGFEFVDKVVGGVIPSQFIPAIEKGVRQVLENGSFAGFPMEDVRVTVHDGKYHSVDSKEIAFVTAGRKAFVDAVEKAGPIVLEPIASVSVVVPNSNMGDIAGELSSRRGKISDTDSLVNGSVRISGSAPLAEMSDFQSRLNAISGGEGSFIMEFGSYEPAPMEVQKKLSAQFKQPEDD